MGFRGERGERQKQKPESKPKPVEAASETPSDNETAPPDVDAKPASDTPPSLDQVILGATPPAPADVKPVEATSQPIAAEKAEAPDAPSTAAPDTNSEATDAATALTDPSAEMEVFYTFRILPRGRQQRGDGPRRKPAQGGKQKQGANPPGGEAGAPKPATAGPGADRNRKGGMGRPPQKQKQQTFKSAPPKQSGKVDPDSPFAVLQQLKDDNDGNLRIGGERSTKPSRTVKPGDVLTFPQGNHVRVIKIVEIGKRRGPAPEAQTLYEDLSPPESQPREKEIRTGPRPTALKRGSAVDSSGSLHHDVCCYR